MSIEDVAIDRTTKALCLNMRAVLDPLAADPPAVKGERVGVMRVMGETIGAIEGNDYYIVDISGINRGEVHELDANAIMTDSTIHLRPADVLIVRDGLTDGTVRYLFSKELEPVKDRIKPIARDMSTDMIARIMIDLGLNSETEADVPEEAAVASPAVDLARRVASCAITSDGIHHSPLGRRPSRGTFNL